ncbi:MAG: hypothetical protein M1833_004836 [Piccolia ochrophora]|nr:MAG: hypothetical protein M1833_004836 [Piccolia ochrophora]
MSRRNLLRYTSIKPWSVAPSFPTYLRLPFLRPFNTTAPIVETSFPPQNSTSQQPSTPNSPSDSSSLPCRSLLRMDESRAVAAPPSGSDSRSVTEAPSSTHESVQRLLPLLRAQASHYVVLHIHARPYLVTASDTVRLPFRMPNVVPGDVLRLTRASVLGSRDYTLKGAPYIDEHLFECRARVMGVDTEPMRIEEKTKRRQRRIKRVKSKHKYTVLKISELSIASS